MNLRNNDGQISINFIIIAALAIVVLVIIFAVVTGRFQLFSTGLDECQNRCAGEYSESGRFAPIADNIDEENSQCTPFRETAQSGAFIKAGQPRGQSGEDVIRCSRCCIRTAS